MSIHIFREESYNIRIYLYKVKPMDIETVANMLTASLLLNERQRYENYTHWAVWLLRERSENGEWILLQVLP